MFHMGPTEAFFALCVAKIATPRTTQRESCLTLGLLSLATGRYLQGRGEMAGVKENIHTHTQTHTRQFLACLLPSLILSLTMI